MRNLFKATLKQHTEHWEKPMSSPSLDPELITKAQLNLQRIEIHQVNRTSLK